MSYYRLLYINVIILYSLYFKSISSYLLTSRRVPNVSPLFRSVKPKKSKTKVYIQLDEFFDGDVVEYRNTLETSTFGAILKSKYSIKIQPLCESFGEAETLSY